MVSILSTIGLLAFVMSKCVGNDIQLAEHARARRILKSICLGITNLSGNKLTLHTCLFICFITIGLMINILDRSIFILVYCCKRHITSSLPFEIKCERIQELINTN